ncbi:hypothetical protein LYZ41_12790 [Elizabethkingia miricola]|uniref:hypothetical protein n=1 Tax=Elizabethkingia miricola TaxID=172045 RepID=UPI001F2E8F44|nr:hypothetical protein [Elizabethkingia miricola]UIO95068.1 hypothetical protein LYZ41_12790 [Elizabethkingia miricola]WNG63990.1 hypothetical protein M9H57_13685 [Elizabethkingia miricola]
MSVDLIWKEYSTEKPEIGVEVLAFNRLWIPESINPMGVRIGFRLDHDFVSAHWWDYQDTYMTISHTNCDDDESYSDNIRNSIEPEKWIEIPIVK